MTKVDHGNGNGASFMGARLKTMHFTRPNFQPRATSRASVMGSRAKSISWSRGAPLPNGSVQETFEVREGNTPGAICGTNADDCQLVSRSTDNGANVTERVSLANGGRITFCDDPKAIQLACMANGVSVQIKVKSTPGDVSGPKALGETFYTGPQPHPHFTLLDLNGNKMVMALQQLEVLVDYNALIKAITSKMKEGDEVDVLILCDIEEESN